MTDELLIKYLLKETSADEQRLVEQWLLDSEANRKQFDEIRFLWERSADLLKNEALPDEEEAWERFKKKREAQPTVKKMPSGHIFQWIAAASVILITGITLWLFLSKDLGTRNIMTKNEVISQTLSDGSSLTINKNTQLSFSSSKSRRIVKLSKGEVFFNVAPDKNKPFIIELGNTAKVTVVGTSFNIKYRNGLSEVIVETGLVKVTKNNQELNLHPGEKVEFASQDSTLTVSKNTDNLYKYFRNKEFIIDNIALQKVVDVLSEAYSTKITLADKSLENLKLNVKFKEEPLDKILKVIAETFGLRLEKNKEGYILYKR
ncbi:anti-FecI sigma factor, FecR [Pseudopedobacter saltans DSM 12145]|uniref:Anti-FecI sigma factor, FecR n=1 Tax=Pseudopedobacter saltans (strain ATCC 51119 / DSM 12145 / JCM 21818 / CCUG 39354 / LMG 10337 / NBRC 100064 / NCIMB 13643) TaxID=762903 RepID=F0SE77_PSESL|nr:FecR domain-containing protein [Pseudopedobacter saltans]ADY53999.1 anti-FecI sigma factor, FecR [Pseudopedobacter saltans DSM 12145]